MLDQGLGAALTTLASGSELPVEVTTDLPERPSAAIEAIAYFCAAELLTNVTKHSGLAGRIRAVDGRLQLSSPPGGPSVVTVELPSHA